MKKYITYEEPLNGRVFTEKQMQEVYRDLTDKTEYPNFECWLTDMIRSGVFEEIKDIQNQTVEFATVVNHGIVEKIGRCSVCVPKTNFQGRSDSIKWYEDKPKKSVIGRS